MYPKYEKRFSKSKVGFALFVVRFRRQLAWTMNTRRKSKDRARYEVPFVSFVMFS